MEYPEINRNEPILLLKNISYRQNNKGILNNIDFDLFPGEIHALVGEHRAGKTALVKLISGELHKTGGEIFLRGRPIDNLNPTTALRQKIGIINQEPQIIPNLTAVENITAGTIPTAIINHSYRMSVVHTCRDILNGLGITIDLSLPIELLSTSEQQMVEIARLIYLDSDILVLDDIGSRFTPKEMRTVLKLLRNIKKQGKSVIFIDSDIDNVLSIADRVTILHHGFSGETEKVKNLDRLKLLKLTYNFALNIDQDASKDNTLIMLEQYNENVIANLPAGVIVLDPENCLAAINKTAGKILDLDIADWFGKPAAILFQELEINESEGILNAIQNHEIQSWDRVLLRVKQSLKLKTIPYRDRNNVFRGTFVLFEDLTQDITIKEYLIRAEKISSVAELAAGVSHEINNPLGIMSNYLQLLKYKNLDEDTAEKLEKMETQLGRIKEITGSLLSFSRFKNFPDRDVNLSDLLNEVVILLNHKIATKSIKLDLAMPAECIIKGSENRLRQVFVNIISNAIEAVPENGRIQVFVEYSELYAEVNIKDNGYGIPPDIQENIFDPFFSTKLTRGNAGLGLSICQHIIEAHKGLITFESRPGDYTVFKIRLPIKQ